MLGAEGRDITVVSAGVGDIDHFKIRGKSDAVRLNEGVFNKGDSAGRGAEAVNSRGELRGGVS